MQTLLSEHGVENSSGGSGEEALRFASRDPMPFVALVDLDLPGMNGAELIRQLRVSRPDIQTIIITAASRDRVRELFGDTAVHLRKPLDFPRLLNILSDQIHS